MNKNIYKHKIEITLLSEGSLEEILGDNWTLKDVYSEMIHGHSIGTYSHTETQKIKPENVQSELVKIGNDGSFFDNLEEEESF
jgi:NifB/MoaA-like Fe-S oxidoreductase